MQAERRQKLTAVESIVDVPAVRAFLNDRYAVYPRTHTKCPDKNIRTITAGFADLLDKTLDLETTWDVESWRNLAIKKGRKPSTCNRSLNALRGLFSRAVEWRIITESPMKLVKKQTESSGKVRFLMPDERARLHAALNEFDAIERAATKATPNKRRDLAIVESDAFGNHMKPAVYLALNTGLRRGELVSLEWANVDLDRAFVTVTGANAKNQTTRHVPLNRETVTVLTAWKKQANKRYVFATQTGRPMTRIVGWARLVKLAKLDAFRWHDFRHDFASRLVMLGVPLNTVRDLLGHADMKMILRYAHLSPDVKAAALALLESPEATAQDDHFTLAA